MNKKVTAAAARVAAVAWVAWKEAEARGVNEMGFKIDNSLGEDTLEQIVELNITRDELRSVILCLDQLLKNNQQVDIPRSTANTAQKTRNKMVNLLNDTGSK